MSANFVISRAVHTGGTVDTDGDQIAAAVSSLFSASPSRRGFVLTLTESSGEAELYWAASPGVLGTGTVVRGSDPPFKFDMAYYGALSARSLSGTVHWHLTELFG